MGQTIARRGFMNIAAAGAASFALPAGATASGPGHITRSRQKWEASFARPLASASHNQQPGNIGFPTPPERVFNNQTLRLIAPLSLGGASVRVKISNAFGREPLQVGAGGVALTSANAQILPETARALSFDGRPSVVIPANATVVSDPVRLAVPDFAKLSVSIYLPTQTAGSPYLLFSGPTFILPDNQTMAANPSVSDVDTLRHFFVTAVDVTTRGNGTVVCIGDSLTAGGWPELLGRKFAPHKAVVNAGVAGNRLLHDGWGESALARFDRDVLAQAGVTDVIIFEGINDIQLPTLVGGNTNEEVSAEYLILALRQLIQRARDAGLGVFGATLTPFKGGTGYNSATETKRQLVNQWIRGTKDYDAVFDFEAAVRDGTNPPAILPQYDSGDHLHFNEAGLQALANAVDLREIMKPGP
jgi:lysophospholipase L1-like esterase